MELHVISAGFFKLDGGAMFGVVPKSLWSRFYEADEKNLCTWAMRSLLIKSDDRVILIDTGLGDKQSEKFFGHYHPHGPRLEQSLQEKGFHPDDITDVILTHLHFDHVGGAVIKNEDGELKAAFKNATYWSHSAHWEWASNPNDREKASFLKENFQPLQDAGMLKFVDKETTFLPGLTYELAHGHTESMIIPIISYKNKTIAYMADLIPSPVHVPLPYVMGYDVRPLETMKEKAAFLKNAFEKNYILFFEHDKDIECCDLKETEKGYRVNRTFELKEIL
ncbi:MAG: MBL fold metallo-hydrolase [Chitinophagaceae bacterium]|nr:MAG: MBL fold metallo-hydrolase [Chitinophagaceae bacterium]